MEWPGFDASGRDMLAKFAKVLAAVENVTRTREADTGTYKYRYADLGDVLDECKRVCEMFGLSIFQVPSFEDDNMTLATFLLDGEGEHLAFPPIGLPMPKAAQAYGSALTYLRRYSLLTIFGIAPEDDDGREATIDAQTAPGRRSDAERIIRESMASMDPVTQETFVVDFKRKFGMSLTNLPVTKHGEALTWAKAWQPPVVDPPAPEEPPLGNKDDLDAAWVGEAKGEPAQEGTT